MSAKCLPLIFLYDWWPILAEARLYDRLAAMPVCIKFLHTAASDAWEHDWPAMPAAGPPGHRKSAAFSPK